MRTGTVQRLLITHTFSRTSHMIRQSVIICFLALVLGGCSDSDNATGLDNIFGPESEPATGVASSGNAGFVSTGSVIGNQASIQESIQASGSSTSGSATISEQLPAPLVEGAESPTLGAAEAQPLDQSPFVFSITTNTELLSQTPQSETAQFIALPEFLFDTARTVRLKVDMRDAVGTEASLSLCTDFQEAETGYKINYQKCPIQGVVSNGQFERALELMNQFDTAVAVIWFPNREFPPRFRKFELADLPEGAGDHDWLWE